MPITQIVSGGQTGADRGGLDAARYCDISHGGMCPKGRKAEDGKIPERFRLTETKSKDYFDSTERNVEDSDATVVFTMGEPSDDARRTIDFTQKHKKPWINIDVKTQDRVNAVRSLTLWLQGKGTMMSTKPPNACILNVAGNCESKSAGIQNLVCDIMVDVLIAVNENCKLYRPRL